MQIILVAVIKSLILKTCKLFS